VRGLKIVIETTCLLDLNARIPNLQLFSLQITEYRFLSDLLHLKDSPLLSTGRFIASQAAAIFSKRL
jgi:hypothetical protein